MNKEMNTICTTLESILNRENIKNNGNVEEVDNTKCDKISQINKLSED